MCFLLVSTFRVAIVVASYIKTMDLVIDIQCLKDTDNNNTPKEIALVALNGDFHGHWLVSSTACVDDLSDEVRRQNNWLTQHCHGINYMEGEVDLKVFYKTLQDLSKSVRKIYVRGSEKWLMLHKIIANEIINLEYDVDCPPFDKLSSNVYCMHHALKSSGHKYRCALNNAYRLKGYLSLRYGYVNKNLIDLHNGQSSNIEDPIINPKAYCRCIPSRSNPATVDQTDGVHR